MTTSNLWHDVWHALLGPVALVGAFVAAVAALLTTAAEAVYWLRYDYFPTWTLAALGLRPDVTGWAGVDDLIRRIADLNLLWLLWLVAGTCFGLVMWFMREDR